MRNLNKLLRQAFARLNGEARAWYFLQQIERRGKITDADVAELAEHIPDGPERGPYLRTIRRWAETHQIPTDIHQEDEMDDAGKVLMVRYHVIDRHMSWEKPKVEALESYRDAHGYQAWTQHPWEPSAVLPVPADPEAAWADFVAWCRDGLHHSAEPRLRKETYLKIFTGDRPYHGWELRQPSEPANNGGSPTADQASL
jgi:hypothetical protein